MTGLEALQAVQFVTVRGRRLAVLNHVIDELAEDPRPTQSKKLDVAGAEDPAREVRRLRLDNWRILYVISEHEKAVDVIPTVTYPRVIKRVGKSPPQYAES